MKKIATSPNKVYLAVANAPQTSDTPGTLSKIGKHNKGDKILKAFIFK